MFIFVYFKCYKMMMKNIDPSFLWFVAVDGKAQSTKIVVMNFVHLNI